MSDRNYFTAFVLCGVGLGILTLILLLLGPENGDLLKKEGGIIETASAAGYFICVGYILYRGGRGYLARYSYFPLLLILFGLRELDFDKAFTTMGIFKSRFYISPEVPLWEKLAGGFFIGLLLWILYCLARNHLMQMLRGLRRFSVVCIGAFLSIALIVTSKGLDGLPRKLQALGFKGGEFLTYAFSVMEEVLELGIPILIFLSFHAWFNKRAPGHDEGAGQN